jgi:splicing suppressor protein 51
LITLLKVHKRTCNTITQLQHSLGLAKADEASLFPPTLEFLPLVPSFQSIDERLRKWIKCHIIPLTVATIHALDLASNVNRSVTHVLRITLSFREDHQESASKYFRISDVDVVQLCDDHLALDEGLRDVVALLANLRASSRCTERNNVIAGVVLDCPPLGPQVMPIGSLTIESLQGKTSLQNWKHILIDAVEQGEKGQHPEPRRSG